MLQIFSKTTNFDFMRYHKLMIAISVLLTIGTFVLLGAKGLNLGTDFGGGILMEVQTPQEANVAGLRDKLDNLGLGTVNIQEFGSADRVLIRISQQGTDKQQQEAVEKVRGVIGESANYRRVEFVGPQVGAELIKKGIWAVVLSTIGILFFVMMRFQWQFGLSSVLALLHDTLMTIGLFAVTRAEFDLSTLAAVLMIGGYSINDTVVVFDRLRENMRKYRKMSMSDLINLSVNATLSRTILTGGTAFLALTALYFLGGDVLKGIVGALMWGIVVGTYSSIFVATPILIYLGLKGDAAATLEPAKA
ncbi:MAG TPA: protein translocase subunit SecF [Alphaproteobacteria bacterium]